MNKEYILTKKWYIVFSLVILLTILSGVFALGVRVGFHKAGFNGRLGERYERNFEGGRRGQGMMQGLTGGRGMMFDRELPSAYTTVGEVLDINAQGLTVMDRDGVEKGVVMTSRTLIRKFRDNIKLEDLKTGDPVVVMGEPNAQGQIEARLIRIMPAPEQAPVISTSSKSTATISNASSSIKK